MVSLTLDLKGPDLPEVVFGGAREDAVLTFWNVGTTARTRACACVNLLMPRGVHLTHLGVRPTQDDYVPNPQAHGSTGILDIYSPRQEIEDPYQTGGRLRLHPLKLQLREHVALGPNVVLTLLRIDATSMTGAFGFELPTHGHPEAPGDYPIFTRKILARMQAEFDAARVTFPVGQNVYWAVREANLVMSGRVLKLPSFPHHFQQLLTVLVGDLRSAVLDQARAGAPKWDQYALAQTLEKEPKDLHLTLQEALTQRS